jgi:hypothetical protein
LILVPTLAMALGVDGALLGRDDGAAAAGGDASPAKSS